MDPKETPGHPNGGPLRGLTVIDLTRHYPGPLCTWLMKAMGADIIKIEIPQHGDPGRQSRPQVDGRSRHFEALHRGKKSLALDYFTPSGRAILLDLLAKADMLLESYRPGVMARAELDAATVLASFPHLIYLSVSGFGQSGPYRNRAGHDLNFLGYSGLLARLIDSQQPKPPGFQIADTAAGGYMATIAALAALHARERDGMGQHVDVSLLDSCLPLSMLQLASESTLSDEDDLAMLDGRLPFYAIYACADGGLIALAALETKFWDRFCSAINRPTWIPWHRDTAKHPICAEALKSLFLEHPRAHWLMLDLDETCLSPVLLPEELHHDPHLCARGVMQMTDQGLALASPAKFAGTPASIVTEPAPELGAHTEQILRDLGKSDEEIVQLRQRGIIG